MNDLVERFHGQPSDQFQVVKNLGGTNEGPDSTIRKCILPGSFNPLHSGHIEMASYAVQSLRLPLWYELSITNADKRSIAASETMIRVSQDFGSCGVVITRAPTFAEKLEVFPNSTFVVGADTITRVDDVRFYLNEAHRRSVLDGFARQSARFLVFGRSFNNQFWSDDVVISESLRALCDFVPRSEFENPNSSTQIRNR